MRRRVNRHSDYDRFLDALAAAQASAGVKNTATAFGLLPDAAERRLPQCRGCERMGLATGAGAPVSQLHPAETTLVCRA